MGHLCLAVKTLSPTGAQPRDRDFFVPDPTGWTMSHLVLGALPASARRQLCGAPSAPPSLPLRFLDGFPVTGKCFVSLLTHPAATPARTSGAQGSLAPSQRHPIPSCHHGLHCDVLLLSLLAPGLDPAGVFLHSTAMRTFGVCWPGPQHRGATSMETLLVGQPLCWERAAEGFPGSPIIPHPLSTRPQALEVGVSKLLCHVPAMEAGQAWEDLHQATSRQTFCSSLQRSPNPSCKLS